MYRRVLLAISALSALILTPLGGQQARRPGVTDASAPRAPSAEADSAYASGDAARAEREYRALLARDPSNSRAVYRLAMLRRGGERETALLLERYASLEPSDPWGWIALGDARARSGSIAKALTAYRVAERLAPRERDVHVGRARMLGRSGHTDEAIAAYERWSASYPRDDEALRELAAQYRKAGRLRSSLQTYERAQRLASEGRTERQISALRISMAPWVQPEGGSSRDSDDNTVWRLGAVAGLMIGDGADLSIGAGVQRTSDGLDAVTLRRTSAGLAWRPRASTRIELGAGVTLAPNDTAATSVLPVPLPGGGRGPGTGGRPAAGGSSTHAVPSARMRYTWRDGRGRARFDLRATHALLDASPILVRNNVVRSEIGGEGELRIVGPLAVRALARRASVRSTVDANSRATLGGRLVLTSSLLGELSAGAQQLAYAHSSTAGYFAPQWARTAEVGLYREVESARGATLALDIGGGAQRVAEWGATPGRWSPALRGWAALGIPIAPGRELRVEVESYDAKIGSEIATAASRWRYASGSVSLRWRLR